MSLDIIIASGGTDTFITLTDAAKSARDSALQASRDVEAVTSQTGRAIASDALKEIHALITDAEACRVQVKKPFIEAGKLIDAKHKEFSEALEMEKLRISRAIGAYDTEQRRLAEVEAKRLRDEAARVENERQKALQDARKAETEAQRAEQLKLAEQLQAQAKAAQAAVVATPPKPAGVPSRKVWRFTVTDIRALYAAKPELCEVTHSQSRINAAIAGGMRECAGLSIFEDTQINAR